MGILLIGNVEWFLTKYFFFPWSSFQSFYFLMVNYPHKPLWEKESRPLPLEEQLQVWSASGTAETYLLSPPVPQSLQAFLRVRQAGRACILLSIVLYCLLAGCGSVAGKWWSTRCSPWEEFHNSQTPEIAFFFFKLTHPSQNTGM